MSVRVVITRHFRKGNRTEPGRLLMDLRSLAALQEGYMSGEILINADRPGKVVTISNWNARHNWEAWHRSPKRMRLATKLEEFLESPEQVEYYLSGKKAPEWVDMA
jgi:antibiotic biosynthesis monooxygenase (ABM) superfamily enzyme